MNILDEYCMYKFFIQIFIIYVYVLLIVFQINFILVLIFVGDNNERNFIDNFLIVF